MGYMILLSALLPVGILAFHIYKKDSNPEPGLELAKAFVLGIVSCFLSVILSGPFERMGLFVLEPTTIAGSISKSFFGAAIPEECAKLFVLWLMLRKNKHFDEHMDGIVYAVFVALGFAFFENVLYLFGNSDSLMSVGVGRALFATPGHFGFGILMGYYYSLACFSPHNVRRHRILALVAPILVHGAYDSLLFMIDVLPLLAVLLLILFLVLCWKLWKYGSARVAEHIARDREAASDSFV